MLPSAACLLFHFHSLPFMQFVRAAHHQLIARSKAGQNFYIAASLRAKANRTTLHLLVTNKIDNLLSTVIAYGRLWNNCTRLTASIFFRWRNSAEERYLHAHVGQNRVIKFVKGNAHFYRRLLAVCRRNDRSDLGRKLAVRIFIWRCAPSPPRLHPINVLFVYTPLNRKRIHPPQRSVARACEPPPRRDR